MVQQPVHAEGEAPMRRTYALVIAAFVIGWAVTMPRGYFWPVWPAIGWGVPLAVRTFSARRGQR